MCTKPQNLLATPRALTVHYRWHEQDPTQSNSPVEADFVNRSVLKPHSSCIPFRELSCIEVEYQRIGQCNIVLLITKQPRSAQIVINSMTRTHPGEYTKHPKLTSSPSFSIAAIISSVRSVSSPSRGPIAMIALSI
jgi:hypothetical protein